MRSSFPIFPPGSSVVGPIAVYEARSRRSLPIYAVGFLSFALAVGPPYALVGVALGGIITSSTLVALFAALLCTAAVTLIVTLLVLLFYGKRKSHEDASYAFDVVAGIKVCGGVVYESCGGYDDPCRTSTREKLITGVE